MEQSKKHHIQEDLWAGLKSFTQARIALGNVGTAIPLREVLQFKMAHANAKDAVYSVLQTDQLVKQLADFQLPIFKLHSQVKDRQEYLQRPDKGRRLNEKSSLELGKEKKGIDIVFVIADGLSARAINEHAFLVLKLLIPQLIERNLSINLAVVEQGRVAIGDEIGELLGAKLSVVMIGERPGLSSFDSMGVYLTYQPKVGLTDESRNCISNIRTQGLYYDLAAEKMAYLITQALHLQISGVALKDGMNFL